MLLDLLLVALLLLELQPALALGLHDAARPDVAPFLLDCCQKQQGEEGEDHQYVKHHLD